MPHYLSPSKWSFNFISGFKYTNFRKDSRPDPAERVMDERPTIEEDLESFEIVRNSEANIQSIQKHSIAFKRKKNEVTQGSSNQMPWLASRATNFIEKKEPAYTGPVAIYRLSTSDLNVSSLQCRDESSKDLKIKRQSV
ncbi:UNVERIFIED_CONTAM: hypothetical protein NCL1_31587 [Trichonephila clavipes]